MRDANKSKEKIKRKEKQAKSPKKQKNGPAENKVPLPNYTNYHFLNAPVDHIYTITGRNLYK